MTFLDVSMKKLNEGFIENAHRSVLAPLKAKERPTTVIASNRWLLNRDKTSINKTFEFVTPEKRNQFILSLLSYEEHYKHSPELTIKDVSVSVTLGTKDINVVTELDKECAKFCDVLYKDVVYDHKNASGETLERSYDSCE